MSAGAGWLLAATVGREELHQGLRQLAASSPLGPVAVKASAPNEVTLAAHGRRVRLMAVVMAGGVATVDGKVLRRLVAELAPGAVSLSSEPTRLVVRQGSGVVRLKVSSPRRCRGAG